MSVHRELAAELRANKAVIDSLNNRNEQLLEQNQRLKQEIHHVVQAALSLGHVAGVTRPGVGDSFYKNLRNSSSRNSLQSDTNPSDPKAPSADRSPEPSVSLGRTQNGKQRSEKRDGKKKGESQKDPKASHSPTLIEETLVLNEKESQSIFQFSTIVPKLFTEQSGSHHSSVLEKSNDQGISGIWLALSIALIITTGFGAGFLMVKPLLGKR